MTLTLILSLTVMAINQAVKLLMRLFGISKQTATKVVFLLGFIMAIVFTLAQQYQLFSAEQLTSVILIFTGAIGSYEMVIRKLGLDSWMKDTMGIIRGQ